MTFDWNHKRLGEGVREGKRNEGIEDHGDLEETQTIWCDQNRVHLNKGMEMRLESRQEQDPKELHMSCQN